MKIARDDGAREARRTAPVPASRLRPVEWAAFGETYVTLQGLAGRTVLAANPRSTSSHSR